ncbi:MAG TPA: bifunctional phosphopantothenoylcysteine decarboxylase/phosphopantothenate--cysteine ligase CoaBC [Chloroflexia bacterium]|nr:bifunctional phosphopantothenoylcysteine decarboxylase/phosphopantothenate--cysteine ligase CoaBC [Chloroflexia bacterium]
MTALENQQIVLGVCGGIAAYKVADLASKLVQAGAQVDVIMTAAAQRFVTPLTFAALTHRPVRTDLYADWLGDETGHVALARTAAAVVVAPATANTIARLALGLSDDLLAAVALATTAPLLLVPAMEPHMYQHPATQAHLATLRERGALILEPGHGRLASGAHGVGRLPETSEILGALRNLLGRTGPLAGRRIVITAGGTQEPLDPVRYIGNRSSGQMGWALAEAALDLGAAVTLIHGPVLRPPPYGVTAVAVGTTRELEEAVRAAVPSAAALVMAAAPADYRPAEVATQKIKKAPDQDRFTLSLVKNPDILAGLRDLPGTEHLVRVGFAAETEGLLAHARSKLAAKGLDLIVANDATSSIGAAESSAILVDVAGSEELPVQPKARTAGQIMARVVDLLRRNGHL